MPPEIAGNAHAPSPSRDSAADSLGPLSCRYLHRTEQIKRMGGGRNYKPPPAFQNGALGLRPQGVAVQIILCGAEEADSPLCVMAGLLVLALPADVAAFSFPIGML